MVSGSVSSSGAGTTKGEDDSSEGSDTEGKDDVAPRELQMKGKQEPREAVYPELRSDEDGEDAHLSSPSPSCGWRL